MRTDPAVRLPLFFYKNLHFQAQRVHTVRAVHFFLRLRRLRLAKGPASDAFLAQTSANLRLTSILSPTTFLVFLHVLVYLL